MLKAVIFDFDGTLTRQGAIDFKRIRELTGCPADTYLLDYFGELPRYERIRAERILLSHEMQAAEKSEEEDRAGDTIRLLRGLGIPVSIISRNNRECIMRSLENFRGIYAEDFYSIISRDDPFPVKPDPASIKHIAGELRIDCGEILMVGDYIHDMQAGKEAGCTTVYKRTGRPDDHLIDSDYTISRLDELHPIIMKLKA